MFENNKNVFEFSYSYENKHNNRSGSMLDSDQIKKYQMVIFKKQNLPTRIKTILLINSLYFQKYNTVTSVGSKRVFGHLQLKAYSLILIF